MKEFRDLESAIAALTAGTIVAIAAPDPTLDYAETQPPCTLVPAGLVFGSSNYAFGTRPDYPLRANNSAATSALRQLEVIEQLYEKWFLTLTAVCPHVTADTNQGQNLDVVDVAGIFVASAVSILASVALLCVEMCVWKYREQWPRCNKVFGHHEDEFAHDEARAAKVKRARKRGFSVEMVNRVPTATL